MTLIIVESPTKAKTLQGFLGRGYKIKSSFGHVRDLPAKELAIDIENNFKPKYVIIPRSKKIITELKKYIEKTPNVILATDEDREGEAIAWHLYQALGLGNSKSQAPNLKRIVFHEITKEAIENALKNPRDIDMNLVDAQQARRILDRLVGYKLSPLLWKKVAKGLSAGRVQSVAVRLVVEKQREIDNFKPEEYWTIDADFKKGFTARLIKKIKNKKETDEIIKNLKGAEYKVKDIKKKEIKKYPLPPFTTSTLQQEASRRLKLSAKQTMFFAQQLYEKGLITYHRTDSLNLSNLFLDGAKKYINKELGPEYLNIKQFKTKTKGAQEAHEAIRPTDSFRDPSSVALVKEDRLYKLIWQRALASQMSPAIFDNTIVDIRAQDYEFRATGNIQKFDGFLKIYPIKTTDIILPDLKKHEILELLKLIPAQHFTQPPFPYTEATLVKALEEHGIGRPSTYAPTLDTIQKRNYVIKKIRYLHPTDIGIVVNDLLVEHFSEIVDIKFTAKMEQNLDDIAQGKTKWVPIIKDFYIPFEKNLKQKEKQIDKKEITEQESDEKCKKCGKPMIIKIGRYGKFLACSGFPKCKNTKSIIESLGIKCPKCDKGEITEIRTKKGKIFYGCTNYPNCDFALWDHPINEKCPKCSSLLVKTRNNKVKCSSKECDYVKE